MAQAATVGSYGTFAISSAGAWTYTASSAHNEFAAGTTYTDTFQVASADGTLTSVTINIARHRRRHELGSTLTGLTTPVTFLENTVNAAAQIIDADVTFTDPDNNFDGGTLTVARSAWRRTRWRSATRAPARARSASPAATSASAARVIGSFAGGAGSTLTVTFNAAATAAGIEALIENLTYANSSDAPTASRSLELKVTDAGGFAAIAPLAFAEQTGAANPFNGVDVGNVSTPSFADLDGDGDLDAVVGEGDGTLNYFENTGSAIAPAFTERTGAANPFNGVDVGIDSTPSFADLDGDGDLDAVVGEQNGTLHYFENTGSATAPAFTEHTGAANPFDGVDVGVTARRASPTSTATATSTPSSGNSTAPCTISRTPARPSRRPSPSAPAPPIRSTASMWGSAARRASPTSTATATSTPSSGKTTAPCTISRTPARPSRRPSPRAPAPPIRSTASMWGAAARRASPTSTATATSTPSSGNSTAT